MPSAILIVFGFPLLFASIVAAGLKGVLAFGIAVTTVAAGLFYGRATGAAFLTPDLIDRAAALVR